MCALALQAARDGRDVAGIAAHDAVLEPVPDDATEPRVDVRGRAAGSHATQHGDRRGGRACVGDVADANADAERSRVLCALGTLVCATSRSFVERVEEQTPLFGRHLRPVDLALELLAQLGVAYAGQRASLDRR